MRYNLGDKIKIKASGEEGTIMQIKEQRQFLSGVEDYSIQYYIKLKGNTYGQWYLQHEIEEIKEGFSDEFEIGLLNLLIDIYLDKRDFTMVKALCEKKKEFMG